MAGAVSSKICAHGVMQIDLVVTDGHDGLLAALASLFPTTLRQRCVVHKQRNVEQFLFYREHLFRHHRIMKR